MMDQIFRQYDIRAKIGSELALDEVYELARAIAYYFKSMQPDLKKVVLGADGRIHSPIIKEEVCRALQESGLDVVYIGTCPTPVLYFALYTLADIDAGLMITASHNGKEYNGIKICLGKNSVWGTQIQQIKQLHKEKKYIKASVSGSYTYHELIPSYIQWLKNHFKELEKLDTSYLIDCGNGAAGTVLPQLIKEFGWTNVSLLYPEVDGNYPNHEADPTIPENMQELKKLLETTSVSCGIGLDGDCDRMTPMTKKGFLVPGDKLLALFAQPVLEKNRGARIVFDVKCSSRLPELIVKWHGVPVMSPSGHSIIKDQMKKTQAILAGELSCHFFFADTYFGYDDGIYALLRLMELIKNSKKNLDELLEVFPPTCSTPEIRLPCTEQEKELIVSYLKDYFNSYPQAKVSTIDGIRVSFSYGWLLVRASNTQSMLCIRLEADSDCALADLKELLISLLNPFFSIGLLERAFNE